jgi:hypothetical protein
VGENLSAIGTEPWLYLDEISVEDATDSLPTWNVARVSAMVSGEVSNYLVARDFGIEIPAEATITGIEFEVRRRALSGLGLVDTDVRAIYDDEVGSSNLALSGEWNEVFGYATYGGAGELWGETWTPAMVGDPSFGIVLAVEAQFTAGNDHPLVDHVRATVYYDVICP